MRRFLTLVLSILAVSAAGCSSCSGSGNESDAAPAASAPVFDEAFCKASLQRCIETVEASVKAYPSLAETRKLCPGLADKREVKLPITDAELTRVRNMSKSADCAADIKVCREARDKVVTTLSSGMKELKDCDKSK